MTVTSSAILSPPLLLAIAGIIFVATWAATGVLVRVLQRRQIMDVPNDRSSHQRPTPRGGGLGLVAILSIAWGLMLLVYGDSSDQSPDWILLVGFVGLAALSWIDDVRGLGAAVRLATHAVAVAIAIPAITADGLVFQGLLPAWLDLTLTWVLWVGFLNFYNFMDGIDGITGVETAAIGAGLFLLGSVAGVAASKPLAGLALAAASAGFLIWNWAPAKLFLGDVGSVPLGFLTGGLLLGLAAAGYWLPAVLLPAYYLGDAGVTFARRALRGEKVWQAHRQHFYQRANQKGKSHGRISMMIGLTNLGLILLAVGSVMTAPTVVNTLIFLIVAMVLVVGLFWWMVR